MSCMITVWTALLLPALLTESPSLQETILAADAAYAHGADDAKQGVIPRLEGERGKGGDYDVLWRLSRARYELAEKATKEEKSALLEKGIEDGERAIALRPDAVEAHYWLGASYGRYAEIRGMFKALHLASQLRTEMEAVLRLSPAFEGCDAFLALGELDTQMPGILGGSKTRAIARMEDGLRMCPRNGELRLALARGYVNQGRRDDAKAQLQFLLHEPEEGSETDRKNREEARKRLQRLE
jgi:hypothetical protein